MMTINDFLLISLITAINVSYQNFSYGNDNCYNCAFIINKQSNVFEVY